MASMLCNAALAHENAIFRCTGGRSEENRGFGFRPAFLDDETQIIYPSRFADGREAPCHLIDGLPDEVVVARHPSGRIASLKSSVISGFVLDGRFFTRDEAAACVASAAVGLTAPMR